MSKHWDYEDDHDWDDNTNYKEMGYVYWYGKYYPKEDINALFQEKEPTDEYAAEKAVATLVLGLTAITGAIYGFCKIIPRIKKWIKNKAVSQGNF